MFHFLQADFDALLASINDVRERMRVIGKEMGESCREGAETFHDNFTHEEGSRQQQMLSRRHSELMAIKGNATIVSPSTDNTHVAIGKTIRVRNLFDQKVEVLTIGSYMVFSNSGAISYRSPLARIYIGAKKGDKCNGVIGGMKVSYIIEEIS